jgi:Phosphodiester glycosidase
VKFIQSRLTRLAQWIRNASKLRRVLIGAPSLFLVVVLWSVSTALLAPGTDPVTARLAEWGRNHYLGSVITSLENLQYTFSKPRVGGDLDSAAANQLAADAIHYDVRIPSIVTPALPGEGNLKTVYKVNGKAAIQVGFLRPDAQHTSYLAGVAIMQRSLLRFVQHAGFSEPGKLADLKSTDVLKGADLVRLAATFNSAFKIKDSLGGYYQNRVLVKPLVAGKATFAIYSDGHADIGLWGTEVSMNPTVVSVRQNLSMLIDNGVVSPNLNESVLQKWGWTVKNAHLVWRSGVGIDLNGNIIYVAGNALSVQSLANVLKAAGAVRAMEFDINPYWISYMWYPTTTDGVMKAPMKLVPFTRPAQRYFSQSSRDFFAVYAR